MASESPDFEHNEYKEDTETRGHRVEEITGQNRVRMIPNKRRPPLGWPTAAGRPYLSEIPSDRGSVQDPVEPAFTAFWFLRRRAVEATARPTILIDVIIRQDEMGFGGRVFFVSEDDHVKRFSAQQFDRLHLRDRRLPELATKTIKYMLVLVATQDRRPTRIRHIECGVLVFDRRGV